MCKVMMMAAIPDDKVDNALQFCKVIGEAMSLANHDGLGYAAIDDAGNLFGERWLENRHAWIRPGENDSERRITEQFPGLAVINPKQFSYNSFGEIKLESMAAITLHARLSTNKVCMENTHPFVQGNTSVIHNGVITNSNEFKLQLSTCDSEAVLINYLQHDVNKAPDNFDGAADNLQGYYACGVLSQDASHRPVLDIFRANGAQLYVCYVHDIGTYVFSTSKMDIEESCKKLKFTHDDVFEFKDEHFLRIDVFTGQMRTLFKFRPASRWSNTPSSVWRGNGYTEYNPVPYRHDYRRTDEENARVLSMLTGSQKEKPLSEEMIAFMELTSNIEVMGEIDDIEKVVLNV